MPDEGDDYFCKQNRGSLEDGWDSIPGKWSWGICDDGCLSESKCKFINNSYYYVKGSSMLSSGPINMKNWPQCESFQFYSF